MKTEKIQIGNPQTKKTPTELLQEVLNYSHTTITTVTLIKFFADKELEELKKVFEKCETEVVSARDQGRYYFVVTCKNMDNKAIEKVFSHVKRLDSYVMEVNFDYHTFLRSRV
ncbi:hypothetical protein EOM81_10400 [bacterium]|nr:hypothetical protein [bacterium]